MKSVLLSIKPNYCFYIMEQKKNVEIRKNRPSIETPFKCYIYCTKETSRDLVIKDGHGYFFQKIPRKVRGGMTESYIANGTVIGEFICDRIEYLNMDSEGMFIQGNVYLEELGLDACLSYKDVMNYTKGKRPYGWHISELKIYDKPKKLNDFYNYCYSGCDKCEFRSWDYSYAGECEEIVCTVSNKKPLARPPQSWCYTEKAKE